MRQRLSEMCQLIIDILQLIDHCHSSKRKMSVDDAEDMIMLRIFNLVYSDLNLFIKLDDDEKETLYMFAVIMSF